MICDDDVRVGVIKDTVGAIVEHWEQKMKSYPLVLIVCLFLFSFFIEFTFFIFLFSFLSFFPFFLLSFFPSSFIHLFFSFLYIS